VGDYTEYVLRFGLRKDTPDFVWTTVEYVLGQRDGYPDDWAGPEECLSHPLFWTKHWRSLGHGHASAYRLDRPGFAHRVGWSQLQFATALKFGTAEVIYFLDWIEPWIELPEPGVVEESESRAEGAPPPGTFIGYVIDEYLEVPTLVYLTTEGVELVAPVPTGPFVFWRDRHEHARAYGPTPPVRAATPEEIEAARKKVSE